jgi:putative ABC transport system ATP-binding protein
MSAATVTDQLVVSDLVKEYVGEGYVVRPLDGLSFVAEPGELVVLLGPSGSGKSTLLSCLGGMLAPTSGSIRLGDVEVVGLGGRPLDDYRRSTVGFVFQGFNLIPSLSAIENVAMPLLVTRACPRREAMARAEASLTQVGLADRLHHRPSQLSGGQQQRVAVARGLVTDPVLLIADEPTANLDHVQAESVIRLLRELRSQGRIIVVSTHDARLVPIADKVVQMGKQAGEPAEAVTTVRYLGGEVVFRQNDHADLVYVIEEGEVEVYRELAGGGEEPLATLGQGQYFGELGALLGFPRSASVRAVSDVVLTALAPNEFRSRVEQAQGPG